MDGGTKVTKNEGKEDGDLLNDMKTHKIRYERSKFLWGRLEAQINVETDYGKSTRMGKSVEGVQHFT
jgi:hypothetical protein